MDDRGWKRRDREARFRELLQQGLEAIERAEEVCLMRARLRKKMLAALPEEQNAAVDLVLREGLTAPEIAARLGASQAAIEWRQAMAAKRIRRALRNGLC